jgi:hypothetical protein
LWALCGCSRKRQMSSTLLLAMLLYQCSLENRLVLTGPEVWRGFQFPATCMHETHHARSERESVTGTMTNSSNHIFQDRTSWLNPTTQRSKPSV